ncbi:MAG: aminopeptidase [Halapricum sp.]
MANDLRAAAETALTQCMGLEPGESCCIVTDDERWPIGKALYDVASGITDDATILRYPPGNQHGAEPPETVAAAMREPDVLLAPTTKSLSHTRARSEATDSGVRAATLPGITDEVFTTGLDADYEAIQEHCADVLDWVGDAEEVRVTSPSGTDITVKPGDREWREDTGIVHEPGAFSNLPAGEVFVSPVSADGRVVVDGTMMPHGLLDSSRTVAFEVENGHVTAIEDDDVREQVSEAAEEVGDAAYNLAELGIGTNVAVEQLVGSVLLDEKAGGTVHFAIGDDASIGGDTEAPLHLDGIVRSPTVYADGKEVPLPTP